MTRTTTAGLAMTGALTLLIGVCCLVFVEFDGPGVAGMAIGAGLGLVNLALGLWIASRALRRGMQSVMATMLGGFFARLVLLAGLVMVFHRVESVNEISFALVFMLFFFVYVGAEIVLVERDLGRARSTA